MFRNYFITAIRRLARNPITSIINIVGLAAGLACAFLVLMYVNNETNYDRHHKDSDRIYRINSQLTLEGKTDKIAAQSMRAGPELKEMFPEVESYMRLSKIGTVTIKNGDKMINESSICLADSNLFDFFDFKVVAGDIKTGIKKQNTIAISTELSDKFFNSPQEAIGQSLKLPAKTYEITLVYDEDAYETHLPYNAYVNLPSMNQQVYQQYMGDYFYMVSSSYIKLAPGVNVETLNSKLPVFYEKNISPWIKENDISGSMEYFLQPVKSIHLGSDYMYDYSGNTNVSYLYIFSWVGVFILLTACFNYMNLATARYSKRAGETGIRKAVGAGTKHLVGGFLSESLITAAFSALLAFALAELFLPVFNALTDKDFSAGALFSPEVLLPGLGVVLVTGLLAGSYPAFYLSRFKPALTLKMHRGVAAATGKGLSNLLHPSRMRKALVVLQFAISGGLMTATLVVYFQLSHMENTHPGFAKENVMCIQVPGDTLVGKRFETIKQELTKIPGVKQVASSSNVPGKGYGELYFKVEREGKMENRFVHFGFVTPEWFNMMEIQMVEGRNFSREIQTDPMESFIINETAARMFGWKEPLDKKVENGFGMNGKVIGVMKDFNFKSLHNTVEPLILMYTQDPYGYLNIKLDDANLGETVSKIESTWKEFDKGHPMEYFFLEDALSENYSKEQKMLGIFGIFSVLTILISAFGLFGLAGFVTEQRTKEIGIRKVMGSSVRSITSLLAKDFMKPVLLALVIAMPITAWVMYQWLQDFAFKIDLSIIHFLVPTATALFIALITVTGTVVKAAKAPPVNALRYE